MVSGGFSWSGRAVCAVVAAVSLVSAASAVDIETVPVGNPGNPGEAHYAGNPAYGDVDYEYNIGKYEVTAAQYCVFLNAVAASDPHGLYNSDMEFSSYGCQITRRTEGSGGYEYDVAAEYANRPVNYVSWGDAARFANWLHNGTPTGPQGLATTEDGAYLLDGATGLLPKT